MPDASELDQMTAIVVKVIEVGSNILEAVVDGEAIQEPVLVATFLVVDGNENGQRTPQLLHVVMDDEQISEFFGQALQRLINDDLGGLTEEQKQELDASIREAIENGEM